MIQIEELVDRVYSTEQRLASARSEAGRLVLLIDSYQARLDAQYDHIALLEERDSRERLGIRP